MPVLFCAYAGRRSRRNRGHQQCCPAATRKQPHHSSRSILYNPIIMLKLEFKEAAAVLLVMGTLSLALALLGTNPLKATETLSPWIRIAFTALGIGLFAGLRLAAQRTPEP